MNVKFYKVAELKTYNKSNHEGVFVYLTTKSGNFEPGLYFGGKSDWEYLTDVEFDTSKLSATNVQSVDYTAASGTNGAKLTFKGTSETNGIIKQGTGDTALQFAKVATSGNYGDLSNKITDITYNSTSKKIQLKVGENTYGAGFNASAFIKDGMLSSVQLVDHEGKKQLKLTFNTDAGQPNNGIVYVDVNDLVDVYTGQNGEKINVTVSNANVISADVKTGSIAKTDLATSVQSSLNKADAALAKPTQIAAVTTASLLKIKYDTNGLITGSAAVTATDIPDLPASKITSGTFADAHIANANTWHAKLNSISVTEVADKNYITIGAVDSSTHTQNLSVTYGKIGSWDETTSTFVGSVEGIATVDDVRSVLTANEETVADALNDLNTRISGLENVGSTKVEASTVNGNIKINGTETKVYTHPSYTAKASGLYKITTDATGHVSAATAVAKEDITALGIPAKDTVTIITGELPDGNIANCGINVVTTVSDSGTDGNHNYSITTEAEMVWLETLPA